MARRPVVIAAAVVAVLLVGVIVLLAVRVALPTAAADPTPSATPSPTQTVPTVSDVYNKLGPSVAVVTTAAGSLGTGVIVAADGTVLTANHVVSDGSAITIAFADGTVTPAIVATSDPVRDIATLTPAELPNPVVPATLGGSAQVGASVIAIGNPLGLVDSVSTGVVSGLDRTAQTDTGSYSGLIQFDASVNPGSSGGPLLDADGDVVGVVVSIADPGHDDAFAGIGFAVPIGSAIGAGGGKVPPQ